MRNTQIKYYSIRLIIVCLLGLNAVSVKANHYYYKQLSLKDGFPAHIGCVLVEDKGFVWIGSAAGLERFDGYELKQYSTQSDSPNHLPHNQIYQIIEDEQHQVWVLTEGGIARYQPLTDDFYLPEDEDHRPIKVLSACLTAEGVVFGAKNRIYQYNYQNKTITKLRSFAPKHDFPISKIIPWDEDTYLCSNRWRGVLLLNVRTGEAMPVPFNCGKEITDMLIDSKNRIWIASYGRGIECFNREGELLASYNIQNSKLSNNIVLSLVEKDAHIWIGTDGGGINVLNPETDTITLLEHIPGDSYSLPVNSIRCLYNDGKNIWAGTIRGGLISIWDVSMTNYKDVPLLHEGGLSDNTVLTVFEESADKIWIGTDGGGVNLFVPSTKRFKHFPSTWGDKVVSITNFSEDELLISLFSKGLFLFNKKNGSRRELLIDNDALKKSIYLNGRTVGIYQNKPETLLLFETHIYKYNKQTRMLAPLNEPEGFELQGAALVIHSTEEATYIHDYQHIYEIDHRTDQVRSLFNCTKDTIIRSVSSGEKGLFWIGDNHGLSVFDPATQKLERIETSLFKEVNSLIYDQKGKLWIGANGMLFAWLMAEEKFIPFGESDGVVLNEYINKSRLVSSTGDIYLGGINGLLQIDHNIMIEPSEKKTLQLTDFKINGVLSNRLLTADSFHIELPWDSHIFSIRVISYERDIFRKKLYRFQILGLNDQYIDSYNPELVIRSLPPGTYHIMASCNTQNGDWLTPQQLLTLVILPPWYKSWWFILCVVLLLTGVVIQTFILTLRRKERALKWAMKEHEQEVYEDKVRFLINISHELRTPLTLIHGPLSRLLKSLSPSDVHYAALKGVFKQAQRMKDLVNMVLDVRKMEVGGSKLLLRAQVLNQWVEQVSTEFIGEAQVCHIQVRFLLDEALGVVSFDASKCEIILANLLINALKHSPDYAEITVSTSIDVDSGRVRIAVSDQGKGLGDVDIEQLFTRFYQGNNEQEGSGIGLSYAKILAELHGGSIGAAENKERGATFFFELPLSRKEADIVCEPKAYLNELIADIPEKEEVRKVDFAMNRYSILLVDDNEDLISFLKEAFEGMFCRIYTACDGEQAMLVMKQYAPDIVISDVMMPRKDGYELCREIKGDIAFSHVPVILLTARNDKKNELYGYKNGADAYLPKPFEVEVLVELLRSQLYNREIIKTRYQQAGSLPDPEKCTISLVDENFLLKLNQIVYDNMDNPLLDITFICKEIGMSRTSLYKKLKVLTAISANDYINKLKMEKAILFITSTDLSFTEIAEITGFSTPRYFSTAFKQYTGETPSNYKRRVRGVVASEGKEE